MIDRPIRLNIHQLFWPRKVKKLIHKTLSVQPTKIKSAITILMSMSFWKLCDIIKIQSVYIHDLTIVNIVKI